MPTQTRVAILSSTFLPTVGGVQLELKWLLDNLDRYLEKSDGLEVHFIYPDSDLGSEEYAQFQNISAHRLAITGTSKRTTLTGIVRLGRLLSSIRPDVIHCYGGLIPDGLWAALSVQLIRMKARIVATSHGSDVAWIPEIGYGMRGSRRARAVIKWVTRKIDRHVQVSQAMVDYAVAAGTPRSIIRVIPNGIPLADEYNFEGCINGGPVRSRDKSSLNPTRGLVIMSLSSGRPVKNVDVLVEAFHLARGELGGSRLLLACVGPQAERIHRLVEERRLGQQVCFIGEVMGPAKHDCFLSSDVYCLTSHFESLGIAALEAMQYETAVVATAVGGVTDFVKDGHNGLLVSPTDPGRIADALVRLHRSKSLRERLVANGLETVKAFSITQAIDKYIELYREVG